MSCEFCKKADFGNFSAKVDNISAGIYLAGGSYRFPEHEQFSFCPVCGDHLKGKPCLDMGLKGALEETRSIFEQLVKPLIKFINDEYNPHTTIIVTPVDAEILCGEMSVYTEEFIKD